MDLANRPKSRTRGLIHADGAELTAKTELTPMADRRLGVSQCFNFVCSDTLTAYSK